MKIGLTLAAVFTLLAGAEAQSANNEGWALAVPGYQITLPRDHFPHYQFRTEWWYFTGNLKTVDGRAFGYQLTFFRHGYRPPGAGPAVTSRFVMNDVKFAHFAVTDVSAGKFHFDSRISRGAYGEAGFGQGQKLAWIDNWDLEFDGNFQLKAEAKDYAIALDLAPEKPAGTPRCRRSQSKGGRRRTCLLLLFDPTFENVRHHKNRCGKVSGRREFLV